MLSALTLLRTEDSHLDRDRWSYPAVVFFFQAEDGIRDATVTGVQTCALPISNKAWTCTSSGPRRPERVCTSRSEERRVGKECRYRWGTGEAKGSGRGPGGPVECGGQSSA